MQIVGKGDNRVLAAILCARALAAGLFATVVVVTTAHAGTSAFEAVAWKLEPGDQPAHHAVAAPSRTNVNLANIVLACERAGDRHVLQVQLYLTDEGPLLPKGAVASQLRDEPSVEIGIDGRIFPASLLFGDDHAVVANAQVGNVAGVSDALIDAMAVGRTMTLRFGLLTRPPGTPAAFDGEAVIDLQADGGRAAVEAVRRCIAPSVDRTADNR